MTKVEQMKAWARENGKVKLVAELVEAEWDLEAALELVYDGETLTKEEFKAKYFG